LSQGSYMDLSPMSQGSYWLLPDVARKYQFVTRKLWTMWIGLKQLRQSCKPVVLPQWPWYVPRSTWSPVLARVHFPG